MGCNQTLHLYVHDEHWERHWDEENKHACTHARTHCCTRAQHTCSESKTPDAVRHAHWIPCVDQNSFLSAFPSKSIPPFGRQTAVSVPGRLPGYTYTHTHTHTTHMHSCLSMCVMASAASLLTPHMLTGAYTSLLAASTAWDPTVRKGDRQDWTKTDNQRQKGQSCRDKQNLHRGAIKTREKESSTEG